MISCAVCRKCLLQITRNHLLNHGITVAEYRERFPQHPLQDESIILRGKRNPFFGKTHSDEVINFLKKREAGIKKPSEWGENISRKHNAPNSKLKAVMASQSYRDALSRGVKNWWDSVSAEEKQSRFEKMRITNEANGYWIPFDERDPFLMYSSRVRYLTEESYRANFKKIVNAHLRGKGYDLDHRLSIHEGFKLNVLPEVIAHYKNLMILNEHDNKVKNRNSSVTLEDLYKEINDVECST